MKFLAVVLIAVLACADSRIIEVEPEIDWINAKPIEHFPEFWDNKPASLRPPASFFENLEKNANRGSRIVNGNIARQHQFPYQASIGMNIPGSGTGLCGGSLISSTRVLTAAHCIDVADFATTILGAHYRVQNEPTQHRIRSYNSSGDFIIHPGWTPALIRNDVALIRLPQAARIGTGIDLVALPSGAQLNDLFAGEDGVTSGWGVYGDDHGRASEVLRYVYDNIMTNAACNIRFPGVIQDTNICKTGTQGRGACSGDSGGPMTVQRGGRSIVVGVVSFGLALGCERSWPSVFARVSSFDGWIRSNMG